MRDAVEEMGRVATAAWSSLHDRMHRTARIPRRMRPHVARSTFTPVHDTPEARGFAF